MPAGAHARGAPAPDALAEDGPDRTAMAAWPRLYGTRARIGLVVPASNTTNEAEFAAFAPRGVTAHAIRKEIRLDDGAPGFHERLRAEAAEAARLLSCADVDLVAYGCTASSMATDAGALSAAMAGAAGVPAVTTAEAILAALSALSAGTVALATPYGEALNAREARHLEAQGIRVAAIAGLGIGDGGPADFRYLSRVPRARLAEHCARVLSAAGKVDALLIACTDLPTLDLVAELEDAHGLPVVTSNQAMLWRCLRLLSIDAVNPALGRLFLAAGA